MLEVAVVWHLCSVSRSEDVSIFVRGCDPPVSEARALVSKVDDRLSVNLAQVSSMAASLAHPLSTY